MFGFMCCADKRCTDSEKVVVCQKSSDTDGHPAYHPKLELGDHRLADASHGEDPTPTAHGVRTTKDQPTDAARALRLLKSGNRRFVTGEASTRKTEDLHRQALAEHGQRPMAAIIGCADSRCPVEILFDSRPGDLFVLRNAGNTCTHAEGSIVGSIEYSVLHLQTNLVFVLGHTKCGAIAGATKTMLAKRENPSMQQPSSVLEHLLNELTPVADEASIDLPDDVPFDMLAAHAVKVNVFHTMNRLMEYSDTVRSKMRAGTLKVEGGIYNLDTGKVDFLGPSPKEAELLGSTVTVQMPRLVSNESMNSAT